MTKLGATSFLRGEVTMLISSARRMIANAGWPSKLLVALLCVVASVPLEVRAQPGAASPRHGWLGLAAEDPEDDAGAQGVIVVDVLPGSPAASAGLRAGDRISAINGRAVGSQLELGRRVAVLRPGTVLKLSVRRGSRVREVSVTLGEPPATPAPVPSRSPPRGSAPRAPSPSNRYHDDDDDDDGYDSSDGAARSNHVDARGNHVDARGNCARVCGRIAQCNVMPFQRCSQLCTGAANDGHTWRIDQESCAEIRKAAVTDKWLCTAEASVGSAVGNGPYTYRNKSMMGTGRTRDEAATQALRDCGAIVSNAKNLSWLGGETVDGGTCRVTRCDPPGTPL